MSKFRYGRLAAVASSALLALMLLGPTTVSAATPLLAQSAYTISPVVRNSDYVAFVATITNNDTSTVSQLFLVEGNSLGQISNGTFYSAKPSQGSCNTVAPLDCSLGQLKPGKTASVTVVYLSPSTGDQATFYATFNTTGLGSGSADNSHGDQWDVAATATLTSSDDFGGRYVANGAAKIVQNLQALSNANPHSTKAFAPATDIYVAVQDIDCTIPNPDPSCSTLTGGFGQISKVNVNNGVDVSGTEGTTLLHFTIQTYASEVPSGKNANNIYVVHTYPTTTGSSTETITTRCTFSPKSNPVPSNPPCITVTKLSGGSFQVDVWTFHNGQIRLF